MLKLILLINVILLVLTSCGFKGPLYLPPQDTNTVKSPKVNASTVKQSASSIKLNVSNPVNTKPSASSSLNQTKTTASNLVNMPHKANLSSQII